MISTVALYLRHTFCLHASRGPMKRSCQWTQTSSFDAIFILFTLNKGGFSCVNSITSLNVFSQRGDVLLEPQDSAQIPRKPRPIIWCNPFSFSIYIICLQCSLMAFLLSIAIIWVYAQFSWKHFAHSPCCMCHLWSQSVLDRHIDASCKLFPSELFCETTWQTVQHCSSQRCSRCEVRWPCVFFRNRS